MRSRKTLIVAAAALTALLALAYWFALGGFAPVGEVPAWITEKPIAHRGLHTGDAERPENSMAAFRAAAEAGYPIELDVHLTKDRRLVVLHDDTMKRLTGDDKPVSEATLAEVQSALLFGSPSEHAPTLDAVLAEVAGRVPVFVEIKNAGDVGPLEDAVAKRLAAYEGDVAVLSFNPYSLGRVAELAPEVPRGQLSSSFEGENLAAYKKFMLSRLLMNWTSRPAFVAYELKALPALGVRAQRLRGRAVLAWTASTPADVERAERVADNVIFDPGAFPER